MRAMDDAGFIPGITSAFRDDYRKSIASGNKAASDSSFHGGSRRGGYGHGLAVDLVSVKGETRLQRFAVSEELWKWIDAHEKELGVGRPYRDRDPPHVGPIDGKEYIAKRGLRLCKRQDCKTNMGQAGKSESHRQALRRIPRRVCCRSARTSPRNMPRCQTRHPFVACPCSKFNLARLRAGTSSGSPRRSYAARRS